MKYSYQTGVIVPFAQRFYKQLIIVIAGLFLATVAATTLSARAATLNEVVFGNTVNESVGENGSKGWWFNRDATSMTPYEFNANAASVGSGSLYIKPVGANPADKFIAEYFALEQMENVKSFSYDFKVGPNGLATQEEQFYLNVYANFNVSGPTKFYDCRYNVVPTVGSTSGFTTVTFDPNLNYAVTQRVGANASPLPCPPSPAAMGANAYIRVFAINLGDSTAVDTGLDGYFDNVVYKTPTDTKVFDFEAKLTPSSKQDCKNNGWKKFNTPVKFKNQGKCVKFVSEVKTRNYVLNSNDIDGINIPTKDDRWYEITITGTWSNRGGEVVDAECTSFSGFPWMNAVFGPYSSNLLDVQVNEAFLDWGPCSSTLHSYTTWVYGDESDINLRVFDGDVLTNTQTPSWFSDNVGSLNVTVKSHKYENHNDHHDKKDDKKKNDDHDD